MAHMVIYHHIFYCLACTSKHHGAVHSLPPAILPPIPSHLATQTHRRIISHTTMSKRTPLLPAKRISSLALNRRLVIPHLTRTRSVLPRLMPTHANNPDLTIPRTVHTIHLSELYQYTRATSVRPHRPPPSSLATPEPNLHICTLPTHRGWPVPNHAFVGFGTRHDAVHIGYFSSLCEVLNPAA